MNDPLDIKLKADNEKLKQEVSNLREVIIQNDALAESMAAEIKNLRTQVDVLSKKAANFQKMYFTAAKLGERTTTSNDPLAN